MFTWSVLKFTHLKKHELMFLLLFHSGTVLKDYKTWWSNIVAQIAQ